ncbi:MAG: hypothetical protein ACRDT4_20990 [Micromonosporaceae bacterium]
MATNDAPGGEPLIFPIGHYTGAFYPTVGSQERHHNVMLGAQVLRLTDEQLTVWLLARGLPDQIDDRPWTRTALEAAARQAGVLDVPQIIAGLVADGLLAETIVGSEHSVDFAESYRLVPLMLGLGNTAEEPWLHGIGFFDQPVLKVASEVYSMWEWAHVDNNLWAACHAHADTATRAGATDPEETVPEKILTGFLGTMHPLLTASAAYLDLAWLDEATEQSA